MSDLVRLHNPHTGVTVRVDAELAKTLDGFGPADEPKKAPAKKAAAPKSDKS